MSQYAAQRSHSRLSHTTRPANHGGRFNKPYRGGARPRPAAPRRGRGKRPEPRLDISKFTNKAVVIEEQAPYVPEHRFADFSLDERLKRNILAKGYDVPTPIQDKAIPEILLGRDVVGIANTGTGKTGAFLIPLVNKVLTGKGERVLVMVPTRELAVQIAEELRGFAKGLGVYAAVCVGGASIGPQMGDLRRNPAFVVGTPGRLKDLLERRAFSLSGFSAVVLDEADRMLDMGFVADMRKLLGLLPKERHTLFFSATLSPEVERLIGEFMPPRGSKEPARISVKTRETAAGIEQAVVRIPRGADKLDILHDLLIKPDFGKVLVFGRTKHGVERLAKKLVDRGFKAESIHGNKTQGRRQKALDLFRRDHVQVLVATDVAARGLDIVGVSHVINYDLPQTHDDYVHRIGRTGRAGKSGSALTFVED